MGNREISLENLKGKDNVSLDGALIKGRPFNFRVDAEHKMVWKGTFKYEVTVYSRGETIGVMTTPESSEPYECFKAAESQIPLRRVYD